MLNYSTHFVHEIVSSTAPFCRTALERRAGRRRGRRRWGRGTPMAVLGRWRKWEEVEEAEE